MFYINFDTNRESLMIHMNHARKHDGPRNVLRLKRLSHEDKVVNSSQVKQMPASRSQRKHLTGSQNYT